MIRINLLPGAEKKARPGRAAAAAPAGGGALNPTIVMAILAFAALDGYLFWTGFTKVDASQKRVAAKKAEKAAIEKEIADLGPEAMQIDYELKLFESQLEILKSLENRILWSQKVNMLAKLIPPSVFLTEINITENFREVEIKSSVDARKAWEKKRVGPKPEVVKKPIVSYTLRLSGLATGSDSVQQLDNVSKFHEALVTFEEKNSEGQPVRFMDNFKPAIAFEFVEAYIYEKKYPVQRFAFKIESVTIGEEDATEGLAAAEADKKGGKGRNKK